MRKRFIAIVFFLFVTGVQAQEMDSVLTVFWNLENFFDYTDQGTGESDAEFSSSSIIITTRFCFNIL